VSNPYEPPKAPLETSQTRPGFPWRLVPSSCLVLFGACMALLGVISVLVEDVRSWRSTHDLGPAPTLGMLIMSTAGVLWTVSGAMFWKRRWWIGIIFLLVGYAVGVFAGLLIWGFYHASVAR
jgi:hypothetical protein